MASEYMGSRMGKLVNRPLIDFTELIGRKGALDVHEQSGFHAANAAGAAEFIERAAHPIIHVDVQANSQKREEGPCVHCRHCDVCSDPEYPIRRSQR